MGQQRLQTTVLWVGVFGSSIVLLTSLASLGRGPQYPVTAIIGSLVLAISVYELRTKRRGERAIVAITAAIVVTWIVTPAEVGTFMDTQLFFGPVILAVMVPAQWKRIAIATAITFGSLAVVDTLLGKATFADAIFRLGVLAVVTIGLIAVIAQSDAARRTALEERTALMDASGAAMIRISYNDVLRRYRSLRLSGVRDIEAWFDNAESRLLDMIRTIDLVNFNDAALALYGLSPDEHDLHQDELLPPEVVEAIRRELVAVWNGETSLERDYEIPLRTGERRWLHQTWNVSIREGRPDYTNVVVTTLDVTDVKAAEEALAEEVRAKDEFIASVSHELRTPLAAVVGLSSELRDRPEGFDAPEAKELLEMVAEQSAEVSFIVEDLLVGARLEAETLSVAPETIDTVSLVRDLVDDSFAVEAEGSIVAWADPTRVRQIVRNLVLNAERYGGGQRRIRVRAEGDRCVLEVRDDGEEVPEAFRAEMFQPYRSEGGQRGLTASVGLGLTVSRRLAELMGGTLEYRYDGESVFALTLPAPQSEPTIEEIADSEPASSSSVL